MNGSKIIWCIVGRAWNRLCYALTEIDKYLFLYERYRQKLYFYRAKITNKTIFVIGDSHTDIFNGNTFSKKRNLALKEKKWFLCANYEKAPEIVTYHLDAVLAFTANNQNSTLKCKEKVKYLINNGYLPRGSKIVISLGEIDCRVHVKRQTELQEISVDKVLDNIVNNYYDFISWLQSESYDIVVYGPIAQQKDSCLLDPMYPRYGSEIERNEIVRLFNEKLKIACKNKGIGFFTIYDKLINKDGTTKDEYLRDGVHLNNKAIPILLKEMKNGLTDDQK